MDDFPISLHRTEMEVRQAAKDLTCEEARKLGNDLFGMDASEAICLFMIEFKGGRPVRHEELRNAEDDPE